MQRLMGFFSYDQFPFVVCLEIEKFDEKGRAYVHQVGWYGPAKIVTVRPLKAGQALKEVLDALEKEHRKQQKDLTYEMVKKVEEMLGVPLKR